MLPLGFMHFLLTAAVILKLVVLGSLLLGFFVLWVVVRLTTRWLAFCLSHGSGFCGHHRSADQGGPVPYWMNCKRRYRSGWGWHQSRVETPGGPETMRAPQAVPGGTPPAPPRPQPPIQTLRPRRRHLPAWSLLVIGLAILGAVSFIFRIKQERAVFAGRPATNASSRPRPGPPSRPVRADARRTPPAMGEPFWTATVQGVGTTLEQARSSALWKATVGFTEFLRDRSPPIEWEPSTDFVGEHLTLRWGEEKRKSNASDPVLEEIYEIGLTAEAYPATGEAILKQDRRHRSEQRLLWLGGIVAGLVVLLGGIAGYLRLDEWSKGYYTGWLKIAAASFVAAAGTALWWWTHH